MGVVPTDRISDLNGLGFHYRDWGGQGRTIILLHGLASNCRIWDLMAPHLLPAFRVFALDQRGHGETVGPDSGYDFDTIKADLDAFIRHLALEAPVLVGHSWGGNVVLDYAASYPDALAGIVMVDGGTIEVSSRPGMTWEIALEQMAPPDFNGIIWEGLLEQVKRGDLGPLWSPGVETFFRANFHISDSGEVSPKLSRENHLQVVRALWEHKPSQLFGKVSCPAMVVPARRPARNDREALYARAKRRIVELAEDLLGNGVVHWMDDTIHDIPLQRPAELADLIAQFASGIPARIVVR